MYKVELNNGIAVVGYLRRGKISVHAASYPHPSNAEQAAKSFVKKHPALSYKVVRWASPDGDGQLPVRLRMRVRGII